MPVRIRNIGSRPVTPPPIIVQGGGKSWFKILKKGDLVPGADGEALEIKQGEYVLSNKSFLFAPKQSEGEETGTIIEHIYTYSYLDPMNKWWCNTNYLDNDGGVR
jgi:hypothetical protein